MIVLDSSFVIGFYNQQDAHHQAACTLMKRFLAGEWGRGLLLEYVFLEVVTVLLVRRDLATATYVGATLLQATELDFLPCSHLFPDAFDMFSRQKGTRLGLTDAAIAHVAQQRCAGLVLTFDEELARIPGILAPA